jgi:ribosomal protein S18 acetylase RimI-like enzyme
VALWLPPGVNPDEEALIGLVEQAVPENIRGDAFSIFEQMGGFHPGEPHWYLPFIGVDPAHQGEGYGTELMRHTLKRCDADEIPAYLENSNPRNAPFYERLGFEQLGVIKAGTFPEIVPMLRKPR